MKKYRTEQQFNDICEDASSGNWTDAFKSCVKFGFYANDLLSHYEANRDYSYNIIELADIAILAEGAQKLRGVK